MLKNIRSYRLSVITFLVTALVLGIVQLKVANPIILLERFIPGGGWIEILLVSIYAGIVAYKMRDPDNNTQWRSLTWTLFMVVFFSQLILGLMGYEKFLMTGKLHIPVPMMILGGTIYRMEISFMPILFFSTIIISGPAWCSQLCYFGAMDGLASARRTNLKPLKNKYRLKHLFLLIVVLTAIIIRISGLSIGTAVAMALGFGVLGLFVILFWSGRRGKMVHCIIYCPIGTLVNYLKFISPFRMYIDDACTNCMGCIKHCKYDALNKEDILKRKPGMTCTLCGDCVASCHTESIKYRLFNLSGIKARHTWIVVTISLHAIFLALARI